MTKYFIILAMFFCSALGGKLYATLEQDTLKLNQMAEDTAKVNLYNRVADFVRDQNTELALYYANNGYFLANKIGYQKGIADAYKSTGNIYWRMGVHDIALNNFFKANRIYREFNDEYSIEKIYNNIALVYFARTELEKALDYLDKSCVIIEKLNAEEEKARNFLNKGLIYFEMNEIRKSLSLHNQGNYFATKHNDSLMMAYNQCFMGKCYAELMINDSAQYFLNSSLKLFEALENHNSVAMVHNQYAFFYIKFSNYGNALKSANIAYEIGDNVGNGYMRMESLKLIAQAYTNLKDYEKALKYKTHYFELLDTMHNESNIKAIAQYEIKYEYEQRLLDIEKAKATEILKNQQKANIAILSAVFLLMLAIALYSFYRIKSRLNNTLLEQNKEITELNTKLAELNSTKDRFFSIIAHDLKNPLWGFRTTADLLHNSRHTFTEEELTEFLSMLKDSADNVYLLLENLLEWSRSQRGTISFNPIEFQLNIVINDNIQLLKVNAEDKKINLKSSVDDNLVVFADTNMLTTVVRNLLSNAVKFTPESGEIHIRAIDSDEHTTISIQDNGVGLDKNKIAKLFSIGENISTLGTSGEKGTGLGLILCKEFIERHNGEIKVESEIGKGTTFNVYLPKIKLNDENNQYD